MNNSSVNTNLKKKKKRFNFIDFLIILLALAIVLAVVYVFVPNSLFDKVVDKVTMSEERMLQYTVEISNIDQAFIGNIKENDTVTNTVSKSNIGTVTAITLENETELSFDGTEKKIENKYKMIVTIDATATYTSGEGYKINGSRIAVGEKLYLRFPDFSSEAYCIGFKEV